MYLITILFADGLLYGAVTGNNRMDVIYRAARIVRAGAQRGVTLRTTCSRRVSQ